jgi:hypothetical protein
MDRSEVILLIGILLIAGGSFLAGFAVSMFPIGRRRGRHGKVARHGK